MKYKKIGKGLTAMFIEATFFNSTAQADCAVFYKRILRSIKHVLSDELSDGACFCFMGTNRGVPNRCNTGV